MAAPLAFLLPLAGGAASSAGKGVAGAFLGPILGAVSRGAQYRRNRTAPNTPPGPEQLIQAYLAGTLTEGDLETGLKEGHGVALDNFPLNANQHPLWQAVLEAQKGVPPAAMAKEMLLRGAIGNDDFTRIVQRNGLFDPKIADYLRDRSEQPTAGEIVALYQRNMIDADEARAWLAWIGVTDKPYVDLLLFGKVPLDMTALMQLVNRGDIDQVKFYDELDQMGYRNDKDKDLIYGLRNLIPGPSDLARYAVRESWTQDVVDTFGYNSEFPAVFQFWMEKQGFGWDTPAVTLGGVNYPSVSWPLAHWRAHWELPSPTQAYSFLQRARATGGPGGGARIPGLPAFDSAKLALLLKTKDYPPYFRPYLEAMSYRTMDTRGIRWARKYDGMTEGEGVERYQDQGYTRDTAEILARTDTKRLQEGDTKIGDDFKRNSAKMAAKCLIDLYAVGGVAKADVQADLESLDLPMTAVAQRLAVVDACLATGRIKQAVASTRRAYLRGELDGIASMARLAAAGVVQPRRSEYLAAWQLEFTPRRKELSTQQVIDALTRGYVSQGEATVRLANLGWDSPDMVILYANAARIIAERAAAADAANKKTQKQAAKEVTDAIKAAAKQKSDLVKELNRIQPLAMMIRLAKKGDITQADFLDALAARDIPPNGQKYYLEDVYGTDPQPPKPPPVPTGTAGSA